MAKSTDFRYNTGDTRVPWPAVGENYNVQDLMAVIRFLMKGEGEEYEAAMAAVQKEVFTHSGTLTDLFHFQPRP